MINIIIIIGGGFKSGRLVNAPFPQVIVLLTPAPKVISVTVHLWPMRKLVHTYIPHHVQHWSRSPGAVACNKCAVGCVGGFYIRTVEPALPGQLSWNPAAILFHQEKKKRFHFVSLCFIFVSFCFVLFRFVSFCFVLFCFVSFRFV
jgi:hypothetical protein